MSEIRLQQLNALQVAEVESASPAEKAGVLPGDLLCKINGYSIHDILDYRFHSAEARLNLELDRDGETIHTTLRKSEEDDAGLSFSQDLGDKIHTCVNKCVFCFIHQMPKKMRKSLYLMDDDFRLSFMHGNYVTLTNLSDEEWHRILEQRLSPLYVSVHATDPELRARLLGRKEPTAILPQLRELAENRVDVHAQIVLCPGLNDGEKLLQTLEELAREHPAESGRRAGVQSVAIVPVGMTRFRERLPDLVHVEREYARRIIAEILAVETKFLSRLGTRFAWLADEWYYLAEQSYPNKRHYEEFPQLEDGIGTARLFLDDAAAVARRLPERASAPVAATLVTAEMPSGLVNNFSERLNRIEGVQTNVCTIRNEHFGGDIRIAGLMTGGDILNGLRNFAGRHPLIYIPAICLRDGELFLDDLTLSELREQSGLDIRVTGNRPADLAQELGLIRPNDRPAWNSRRIMEQTTL